MDKISVCLFGCPAQLFLEAQEDSEVVETLIPRAGVVFIKALLFIAG